MKYIALLLLPVLLLAGTPKTTISLRIERAANVDSVTAVAMAIDPRMGEMTVINSAAVVIGYVADSLGDTTRFAHLRAVDGVSLFWSVDSL